MQYNFKILVNMDNTAERLIALIQRAQKEHEKDYYLFIIPQFLSKKFISHCAMKEDVSLLTDYIKLLRTENSITIKSSLTYSLIVLYGKFFTDASHNKNSKLEAKHLFAQNENEMKNHEMLMNLRHNFVAHRGETDSEIGIAFMIVPKIGEPDDKQMRFSQLKQYSFSTAQLNKIEKLLNVINRYLEDSVQKQGQKLNDSYLKIFTPEQISLMVMNNKK